MSTSGTTVDLGRLAHSLTSCAAVLDPRAESGEAGEPGPEVVRVRRLLTQVAADLARHAAVARRLDDEIELLTRRRDHADAAHLAELCRRRDRSEARLRAELDNATRALVPGGDLLEPATILKRLTGSHTAVRPRSYFGRPTVDRDARVLRLATLLRRRVAHPRAAGREHRPTVVTIASRTTRLARVRRRLLRSFDANLHTTGASS